MGHNRLCGMIIHFVEPFIHQLFVVMANWNSRPKKAPSVSAYIAYIVDRPKYNINKKTKQNYDEEEETKQDKIEKSNQNKNWQ